MVILKGFSCNYFLSKVNGTASLFMNSDSGRRGGFNHTIIIDLLTCGVYNHIVSLLIIETSQADR